MSRLPNRPTVKPNVDKFGINKDDGVWANVQGFLRTLVDPSGIHLKPSDFSDLQLPAIRFQNEKGIVQEFSVATKSKILLDGEVIYDPENIYTKKQVDDLFVLKSPNGTKYKVTVSDTGVLTAKKEVS